MRIGREWRIAVSVGVLVLLASALAGCRHCGTRRYAAHRPLSWVELYDECKDSVVVIGNAGTGFIIDKAGYIVTNAHVLRQTPMAQLSDGSTYMFRIVAADISQDLALVKIDADKELKPAKIGRSNELKIGQPVMTLGNPDKFNFSATAGIVSGLNRAAHSEYTGFTGLIQTDAAINPGNSGGPLFNQHGEVIGINTCSNFSMDNLGFAISIDTAMTSLPEIVMAPEHRFCFTLGLKLDPFRPGAVTEVRADSPAEAAGLKEGDVIARVNDKPVERSFDFYLVLIDRLPGDKLDLAVTREGETIKTTLTLGDVPQRPAEKVENTAPGLRLEYYAGKWEQLPDFDKLTAAETGVAKTIDVKAYKDKDYFGLRFTGYIEVPTDGTYTFYTDSDDGSRLWIGDQLIVDNDFTHATMEQQGRMALRAGRHPITVTFFEHAYGEELRVLYQGPGIEKQVIPASALYHVPAEE